MFQQTGNANKGVLFMRNLGPNVDDDNELSPENIPKSTEEE